MDIKKDANGNELILTISGRLDTTTSPVLDGEIKNSADGITRLVLDLEKLDYISSAGLRVVLAAQKMMNKKGEMIVRKPCDSVMEVFDVTGFTDILTIEE